MSPAVGLYIPEKKQTGGLLEDMKFSEVLKKYSKCNFQRLNIHGISKVDQEKIM